MSYLIFEIKTIKVIKYRLCNHHQDFQMGEMFMRKTVSAFLAVFMCLFVFTACGPRTIEDRVSKADLQKMCDEIKSNPLVSSVYSDVKVEVEGNNITYMYYIKAPMDDLQMTAFKSNIQNSDLKNQISGLKDNFEKQCGIRPDKVTYKYYTSNDQIIVTVEE